MRFDAFCGPSYLSHSLLADCQRTMNFYPELIESQQGKNQRYALIGTPGVSKYLDLPFGPVRGMHEINGRVFVVSGPRLYEITDAPAYTEIGTVATDPNPATLCSNGDSGNQLFVTSGDRGYLYNLSTGVYSNPVNDVTMGGFLHGWFVALDATSSTLKISDLENGASWTASQVAQRNTGADRWVGMRVSNGLIRLWGNRTSEAYWPAGTAPFPFQHVQESFRQIGTISSFANSDAEGMPMFVGQSSAGRGVVYRINGLEPERVSDHAVEQAIQGYSTVSDAVSYHVQMHGHPWSILSFPTARATWVFDHSTRGWFEMGYWDSAAMRYEASRQLWHVHAFNRHLVGDRDGAAIYTLSPTTYTDVNGAMIRRVRRAPHLNQENFDLTYHEFELDIETGLGNQTGSGVDPQLMLRWSNDGGVTWGNDHQVSAGRIGSYSTRAIWRRLGRGRDRVFELVVTDPIAWRIANAYLRVTGSREMVAA